MNMNNRISESEYVKLIWDGLGGSAFRLSQVELREMILNLQFERLKAPEIKKILNIVKKLLDPIVMAALPEKGWTKKASKKLAVECLKEVFMVIQDNTRDYIADDVKMDVMNNENPAYNSEEFPLASTSLDTDDKKRKLDGSNFHEYESSSSKKKKKRNEDDNNDETANNSSFSSRSSSSSSSAAQGVDFSSSLSSSLPVPALETSAINATPSNQSSPDDTHMHLLLGRQQGQQAQLSQNTSEVPEIEGLNEKQRAWLQKHHSSLVLDLLRSGFNGREVFETICNFVRNICAGQELKINFDTVMMACIENREQDDRDDEEEIAVMDEVIRASEAEQDKIAERKRSRELTLESDPSCVLKTADEFRNSIVLLNCPELSSLITSIDSGTVGSGSGPGPRPDGRDSNLRRAIVKLLLLESKAIKWYNVRANAYLAALGNRLTSKWCEEPTEVLNLELKSLQEAVFAAPEIGGSIPKAFLNAEPDSKKLKVIQKDGMEIVELD